MRALAALLLAGCAHALGTPAAVPQELSAIGAVWALYQRTDAVPVVRWVNQDMYTPGVGQVDGLSEGHVSFVRRMPPTLPISQTSMAHELYHHACARRGPPYGYDPGHLGPGWEGQLHSEVDAANAWLRGQGL